VGVFALIAAVLSPATAVSTAVGSTVGATVTTVWTDFGGLWKSDTDAVVPDLDHNLLAFTAGGTVYSTGVDDAALAGVSFTPSRWRALPVEGLPTSTGAMNYLVVRGSSVGAAGFSANPSSADLSTFLTDGSRGLNLGSGIANIPLPTTLTFNLVGGIGVGAISDGVPDILITQIANPTTAKDKLQFQDSSGNLVGNFVEVDQNASGSISRPGGVTASLNARYYTIPGATEASGFIFPVPSIVRMRSYELSEFGINAGNAGSVSTLVWIAGGSSDPAFFAYNEGSISAVGSSTVVGSATTTLAPIADTPLSNLTVTASATSSASLTLTYSTTTAGVCTVDANSGVITLVTEGTCTVTAGHPQTQVGSTIYPASSDTGSFSVTGAGAPPGSSGDEPTAPSPPPTAAGAIALELSGPVNGVSERAVVNIVGTGLTPGSRYRLSLGSPEAVLIEGEASASGSFSHQLSLPANLAPQTWVMVLTAQGDALALTREFSVSDGGTITDYGVNVPGLPSTERERLAYTGYGSSVLPWWATVSLAGGLFLVLYSARAQRLFDEELRAAKPVIPRGPWEILATPIRVPGIAYTPGGDKDAQRAHSASLAETMLELDRAMSRIIALRLSAVSSRLFV